MAKQERPKEKKRSFLSVISDPQNLVAYSAVFISACALFVSFYEARIMRRWQQASLWPRIQIGESYSTRGPETQDYFIIVGNSGVGPADIKGVQVDVGGKAYDSWKQAFSALLGEDVPKDFNGFSEINGNVLPPNNATRAFSLNMGGYYARIMAERHRLDVKICYCDVFDNCWITTLRNHRTTTPVDACPVDEYDFQE